MLNFDTTGVEDNNDKNPLLFLLVANADYYIQMVLHVKEYENNFITATLLRSYKLLFIKL